MPTTLTSLVADTIIFNSHYNMTSFLSSLQKFFKTMPDYRPSNLRGVIEHKCKVLYFPIEFPDLNTLKNIPCSLSFNQHILKIAWPHRWLESLFVCFNVVSVFLTFFLCCNVLYLKVKIFICCFICVKLSRC